MLRAAGVRLAVLNACNSGQRPFMKPLMAQGLPAATDIPGRWSTTPYSAFSSALYGALGVGLSLDEAVTQARLLVLRIGLRDAALHPSQCGVLASSNDWLRFMVYMPTDSAVLFPRPAGPSRTALPVRSRSVPTEATHFNDSSIPLDTPATGPTQHVFSHHDRQQQPGTFQDVL